MFYDGFMLFIRLFSFPECAFDLVSTTSSGIHCNNFFTYRITALGVDTPSPQILSRALHKLSFHSIYRDQQKAPILKITQLLFSFRFKREARTNTSTFCYKII